MLYLFIILLFSCFKCAQGKIVLFEIFGSYQQLIIYVYHLF